MKTNEFAKSPLETYPIGMDYEGKAPPGAILVSGEWTAWSIISDADATVDVLTNTSAIIDDFVAKVRVQGGVLGEIYRLGIAATFDTGDVLHDNVYMSVTEYA